jgi:hypothetical protein
MSARFTADLEFQTMESLMDDIDKAVAAAECGFVLYDVNYVHWKDGVAEVVFMAFGPGSAEKLAGAIAREWGKDDDELAGMLENIAIA